MAVLLVFFCVTLLVLACLVGFLLVREQRRMRAEEARLRRKYEKKQQAWDDEPDPDIDGVLYGDTSFMSWEAYRAKKMT